MILKIQEMLIKKYLFSLIVVACCWGSALAADFTISGKLSLVTQNVPVPFYQVEIKSEDGQFVGKTQTGFSGKYSLTFELPENDGITFLVSVTDICTQENITKQASSIEEKATVNFTLCSEEEENEDMEEEEEELDGILGILDSLGIEDVEGIEDIIDGIDNPEDILAILDSLGINDIDEIEDILNGIEGQDIEDVEDILALLDSLGIEDIDEIEDILDGIDGQNIEDVEDILALLDSLGVDGIDEIEDILNGIEGQDIEDVDDILALLDSLGIDEIDEIEDILNGIDGQNIENVDDILALLDSLGVDGIDEIEDILDGINGQNIEDVEDILALLDSLGVDGIDEIEDILNGIEGQDIEDVDDILALLDSLGIDGIDGIEDILDGIDGQNIEDVEDILALLDSLGIDGIDGLDDILQEIGDVNIEDIDDLLGLLESLGIEDLDQIEDILDGVADGVDPSEYLGCQAFFFFQEVADDKIQFNDLSLGDSLSWEWDFGDGNTSTEQNPVHAYQEAGVYEVTLKIKGKDCENSFTLAVFSDFDAWLDSQCQALFIPMINGLSIQFWETALGEVTDWAWDFGDGTTSTEEEPSHTYEEAGTYLVSLMITTASGCSSTFDLEIEVSGEGFGGNIAASLAKAFSTNTQEEALLQTAELYPTIVQDQLTLKLHFVKSTDFEIQIQSINGYAIYRQNYTAVQGDNALSLSVSDLPKGVYLARVKTANGERVLKFIAQ